MQQFRNLWFMAHVDIITKIVLAWLMEGAQNSTQNLFDQEPLLMMLDSQSIEEEMMVGQLREKIVYWTILTLCHIIQNFFSNLVVILMLNIHVRPLPLNIYSNTFIRDMIESLQHCFEVVKGMVIQI